MMGQQQETVASGALRRVVVVLVVAALMAAMVSAMAAPAFAKATVTPCSEVEPVFKGNIVTGGNGATRFNCHAPGGPGR